MLIAQTSAGIARRTADGYELLDTAWSLYELIRDECLDSLIEVGVLDVVAFDSVTTLPPVHRPGKVCIVGLNYTDHAEEIGVAAPSTPRFSWAAGSSVIGSFDDIVLPEIAPDEVDYEGELAVVIGSHAKGLDRTHAWSAVAGVCVANDVSARDVQRDRGAHGVGANVGVAKSFDTFTPLGPALLTADELTPGTALQITTTIDGELRQSSTTANMLFGIDVLVSTISRYATLEPGDVILTGTPAGVGLATGRFLRPGQLVEVEIERIGVLRNRVVSAP
jgi:2-keto-4-pentenoate hydratase/2-oxohepta-3-ene-1,7-dioic acid hydratase in catechol pathway